jgi:site-specific DNA-methyltransferase (adenine-specific)
LGKKEGLLAQVLNRSIRKWWKGAYNGVVYRYRDGEVVCEDALRLLNSLRAECANVVFLDPPFNLGKAYGNNGKKADRKSEADYRDYMTKVLVRAAEVLVPGGALYLYHIPKWAIQLACDIPSYLEFRHWIAISIKSGFVRGRRLYPAHYALLYYTKGKPKVFSRPKIPRPVCARCKKDLRDYGGYKKFVESGINLSDIWDDISPVRHKNNKHRRSNELPLKLVSRILTISGIRGGLVIDPFAGAGSMLVAARQAKMHFVGGDMDRDFLDIIDARFLSQGLARVHSGGGK